MQSPVSYFSFSKRKSPLSFVLFLSFIVIFYSPLSAQTLEKEYLEQLKFRHIGPIGNRIVSVTSIPGNPMVYYVGAASGGIWKTVDGGLNWKPIFDDKPVHAIGALALAPSDPQVVYAGTGEAFIRSNVSLGNGVWKSMDGGESWEHTGLDKTGRISRIVVHPENPDIAFATALGHAYTPQKDRGVYRTQDGGDTWEQVLFVDENTGSSDSGDGSFQSSHSFCRHVAIIPQNLEPYQWWAWKWNLYVERWGGYLEKVGRKRLTRKACRKNSPGHDSC